MSQMVSGFLAVYKPKLVFSTFSTNTVKKYLGINKIGHSGILDSYAEGVLVMALGRSTKLLPYLLDSKSYLTTFRFGQYSPSIDLETPVLIDPGHSSYQISKQLIQDHCKLFHGVQNQVVPLYSANKVNGQRMSDLVRQGVVTEPRIKSVNIDSIRVVQYTPGDFPEVTLQVDCHSGTYIRSLCRDLAHSLGTSAIVTQLIRTSCSGLEICDAYSLESIQKGDYSIIQELEMLQHIPLCILTNQSIMTWNNQSTIKCPVNQIILYKNWDWQTLLNQHVEGCSFDLLSNGTRVILGNMNCSNGKVVLFGLGSVIFYKENEATVNLYKRYFLNYSCL